MNIVFRMRCADSAICSGRVSAASTFGPSRSFRAWPISVSKRFIVQRHFTRLRLIMAVVTRPPNHNGAHPHRATARKPAGPLGRNRCQAVVLMRLADLHRGDDRHCGRLIPFAHGKACQFAEPFIGPPSAATNQRCIQAAFTGVIQTPSRALSSRPPALSTRWACPSKIDTRLPPSFASAKRLLNTMIFDCI